MGVDELVFGISEAAWPAIRNDVGLDYATIGLLLTTAALVAGVIEPFIALAANATRRPPIIRAGGVAFAAALVAIALAQGFPVLLVAFVVLYPASGAFVSLTQATLMDREPGRRDANMARWVVAGSAGLAAGPVLVAVSARAGLGWRPLFVIAALLSFALALTLRSVAPADATALSSLSASARLAIRALRQGRVLRWLLVIETNDLLGDVFAGFVALYFVDVVHLDAATAALAVLVWGGAGLAADAALLPILERASGVTVLRVTAVAMLGVYPAFLLVPAPAAKLVLLGAVAVLHAGWYALPQARLYDELADQSHVALAVSSLSTAAAAFLPLGLGLAAARWGLSNALWLCAAAPLVLLLALPRGSTGSPPTNPPSS